MSSPSLTVSDEKKVDDSTSYALEAQLAPHIAHDKALALFSDPADVEIKAHFDVKSPEAVAVKNKIDRWLMPLLFITVLFQNLDNATLSYGSLMGLKTETHLHGSNYSWLGSLVYFGFLSWEIPAAFLLQRLPIAKYAAGTVASDFAGLAACRFLLGVLESSVTPAFVLVTGAFYTQDEQVNRIALHSGQVVGGLLTYGIYHLESFRWEALYLIFGRLTIIHGIICWFILADSPSKAFFLTTEERIIALERVRLGKAGSETWKFNPAQLKEALMDSRLYLFFLMMVCCGLPNGGVPTIIVQFGFSSENTILLQMAPGLSEFVGIVFATQLFKRTKSRGWVGASCISIAVIGIILMLTLPVHNKAGRFVGYCLLYCSAISGTTKKLAFNVAYNLGYCIGNILGPQTYQAKDAPAYLPAKYSMLAFVVAEIFIVLAISYIHKFENQRRDREDAEDLKNGVVHSVLENEEFLDLTDKQQRGFRYPI